MYAIGAPLGATMDVYGQLKRAIPKMRVIWKDTALQRGGRDTWLQKDLEWGEEVQGKLDRGELTLNHGIRVHPD